MSRRKAEGDSSKVESPGFEQALERLETIVAEMESGELSLELMMARFEEGQKLVKQCAETLSKVERRIEMLVKEGDTVVVRPFEEAAAASPGNSSVTDDKPEGLPF